MKEAGHGYLRNVSDVPEVTQGVNPTHPTLSRCRGGNWHWEGRREDKRPTPKRRVSPVLLHIKDQTMIYAEVPGRGAEGLEKETQDSGSYLSDIYWGHKCQGILQLIPWMALSKLFLLY